MSCCSLCTFSACHLLPCPADDCDQQFCCQDHLERFFPLLTSYKDGHFCHLMFLFELCLVQTNEIKNPRPIKKYLVQTQRQKWHLPILHCAFGPCRWKVEYKQIFLSLCFLPIMWLWINNSLHVPISHCYVLIEKHLHFHNRVCNFQSGTLLLSVTLRLENWFWQKGWEYFHCWPSTLSLFGREKGGESVHSELDN